MSRRRKRCQATAVHIKTLLKVATIDSISILVYVLAMPEKKDRIKKCLKFLGATVVLILFLLIFAFYCPTSPDGIYFDPGLACGQGVWIFKDGEVYVCCVGEEPPRKAGAYSKVGRQWMASDKKTILKPTMLGIRIEGGDLDGKFFLRDQLSWVYDIYDWFRFLPQKVKDWL